MAKTDKRKAAAKKDMDRLIKTQLIAAAVFVALLCGARFLAPSLVLEIKSQYESITEEKPIFDMEGIRKIIKPARDFFEELVGLC